MNKVISFGSEQDPSLLQLKLIVYNIIDYSIAEAYKICDGINPENISTIPVKDTKFFCSFSCNKDNTVFQEIEFGTDYNELINKNDNHMYDIKQFSESYGISNYALAIFIFCTLHECGHMISNQYFRDRLGNRFGNYFALRDNISSAIFMALSHNVDDPEYDGCFDYCYDPDEQLANRFAYLNFKKVWDMLISRGLII